MEETLLRHGLPLAALLVFASAAGIPTGVPVKAVLLAAGALLVRSPADLPAVFGVLLLAEVLGTLAIHSVGGVVGPRLMRRLPGGEARLAASVARWRARLGDRDALAVFVLRFVPVVRIGVAAGSSVLGLRRRDFLLGAAPASLFWVGVPLGLGWLAGEHGAALEIAGGGWAWGIAAVMVGGVLALVAVRVMRARRGGVAIGQSPVMER